MAMIRWETNITTHVCHDRRRYSDRAAVLGDQELSMRCAGRPGSHRWLVVGSIQASSGHTRSTGGCDDTETGMHGSPTSAVKMVKTMHK